ncbi:MAG: SDR family oxidoreductase [Myxacorys chilensis ATA2-1-KO14]|jgi:NAD(P)-dependent dehydrogenase (short-subunit alcohol dehydrogenase family)|nr:SDR family oxidoreductase [Myxacorys chilensis ATA2-1-KO14]
MSLSGKRVVIIGASSGIGLATALAAAEAVANIASKILGPFYAVKHADPRLSQKGSITFFSGVAAWKLFPNASVVSAANAALAAFARSLAVELAPIRVNAVSPGVVEMPSWNEMPEEERNAFFENLGKQLPARRIGQANDLADAVLFLMQNRFTTGTVLHVDGGHRLI